MAVSTKDIDPRDRLIFALDVPDVDTAKALVEELGDSVSFEIVPHHDAVILRRAEPSDDALHLAISDTINEWISAQDLESFQDLGPNPQETPHYRGTRIALKSLRS